MVSQILMFSSRINDQPVSLSEAFSYIEEIPTNEFSTEAFIGFVNEKEEVIQFMRYTENSWLFDIPLQDAKTKQWNNQLLQLEGIPTTLVKRIVENFFVDLDLIYKINSKYRLDDTAETAENITYVKIDRTFIHWIEQHGSDELYS